MASISPVTDRSAAGYVDPGLGVYGGALVTTASRLTLGKLISNRNDMRLSIFFFGEIDASDSWSIAVPGVVATAWQADQADTDQVTPTLTVQDSPTSNGTMGFQVENSNAVGWVWVLHRG